ncbi:MAG: hypothetical protein HY040_26010 [Planctomycetes bacterium]|nr:hypothetical protein [Planctomycetota bacterium]
MSVESTKEFRSPVQPQGTRPRLLDYLLICAGAGISAMLADFSGVRVLASESASPLLQAFAKTIPFHLFLPIGILLFWPIFQAGQRVLGREQGLTAGEWLVGLSWLGALGLTGYLAWKGAGAAPEFLTGHGIIQSLVSGYIFCMIALGSIAALLIFVNLLTLWRPRPWTHTFGLVLLMWPLVPLAAFWCLNLKLE